MSIPVNQESHGVNSGQIDPSPFAESKEIPANIPVSAPDTLSSAQGTPAKEGCLSKWVLAIPRLILTLLKNIAHILSCCTLFKNAEVQKKESAPAQDLQPIVESTQELIDPKVQREQEISQIQSTLEKWKSGSDEEKKESLELLRVAIPDLEERILPVVVKHDRDFELMELKEDEEKIKEWDAKHLKEKRAELTQELMKFNKFHLEIYLKHLSE